MWFCQTSGADPEGLCQNSGPRAWKAPDPVFPALGLRFETRLLLLMFLAEIGGRALSSDGARRAERNGRYVGCIARVVGGSLAAGG